MQTPQDRPPSPPGPWGEIECFPTYLDPPASYFDGPIRRSKTEWLFLDHSRDQVVEILEEVGIDPADLDRPDVWLVAKNGVVIRPHRDFLDELPPEKGNALAAHILALGADNSRLNEFVIERGSYREFTRRLDIPEKLIRWTEERCFQVGRKTVFASAPHALDRIEDRDLQTRYLESLVRCRSLVARLRIRPGHDLEAISDWWRAGPNRSRALPLLEAALATRGVETIDILHLLPPVPRRLLNTYALERDRHSASAPDCYWAAMNFFESTASSRYLDEHLPRSYYFQEQFEKVSEPCRFGDVIMLFDREADRFVHAWVYIADDIVYTKNGSGRFFPYVLMRGEDMLTRYVTDDSLETEIYRYRAPN